MRRKAKTTMNILANRYECLRIEDASSNSADYELESLPDSPLAGRSALAVNLNVGQEKTIESRSHRMPERSAVAFAPQKQTSQFSDTPENENLLEQLKKERTLRIQERNRRIQLEQQLEEVLSERVSRPIAAELANREVENTRMLRGSVVQKLRACLKNRNNLPDTMERALHLSTFGIVCKDILQDFLSSNSMNVPYIKLFARFTDDAPSLDFIPAVDSELKDTFEDLIRENRGSNNTVSKDEVFIWNECMQVALNFSYERSLLPEEQFRSGFWSRMFDAMLYSRLLSPFKRGPEFRMKLIKAYEIDARVDFSVFMELSEDLSGNTPRLVTLFLSEASAGRITGNAYHKDYSKLAVEMLGCLMENMAQDKNAETRDHLIFGSLTSGVQIQFCSMLAKRVTVNSSQEWCFVFQAPKHWFIDFADDSFQLNETADCHCCTSSSGHQVFGIEPFKYYPETGLVETMVPIAEPSDDFITEFSRENKRLFEANRLHVDKFMPRLVVFSNICKDIVAYGKSMSEYYTKQENLAKKINWVSK
jgi:hypothetical protein